MKITGITTLVVLILIGPLIQREDLKDIIAMITLIRIHLVLDRDYSTLVRTSAKILHSGASILPTIIPGESARPLGMNISDRTMD